MSLVFSDEIKNARLQSLCDAIDVSESKLIIYNESSESVCEIEIPVPCQFAISAGILTFNDFPESMVMSNATLTNAEIVQDETVLVTMSIGDNDSSADLRLPTTTVYSGTLLRLNGWTITEN